MNVTLDARYVREKPSGIGTYVQAAGALVQPSLYKGFGLPVIEAVACGLARAAGFSWDARAVRTLTVYREAMAAGRLVENGQTA
jgi:hypothetical protein